MSANSDEHPSDDLIERYSLGMVQEDELGPLEEHLLICGVCQDRVAESDDYVAAMRRAAAKLKREQESRTKLVGSGLGFLTLFGSFRLKWVLAGVVLVFVAGGIVMSHYWVHNRLPAPVAILLEAKRGLDDTATRAPSGKSLVLEIDTTQLAGRLAYVVEVVDSGGHLTWKSSVRPQNTRLRLGPLPSLRKGRYWVRLYGLEPSKELLREYGLEVR
jgi:hypothetical protein